ncbi:MAG: C45 family autoproteolytic acyltransferase/hydrolase [Candidatus Odinarchaeota archaeon]
MEGNQLELVDVKYHHLVLEGSQYEAGKQLAQLISEEPGAKEFFTSGKVNLKKLGFKDFDTLWSYCEECCPGITDEMQGFADELNISPQNMPFWNWTFAPSLGGGCSQFTVLSSATQNQHIYAGRSYEWTHKEEDLKFFTNRINGKANHIGFSCLLFGRHDGINEHGLVVSMSGGGIFRVPFKNRGPMFWLTIRALLDQSTSVKTALDLLETLPMTGYLTFMLVDKTDCAALVEVADGSMSVKRINHDSPEPYDFSVNHFRHQDMIQYNELNVGIIHHSKIREAILKKFIEQHATKMTKQNVKDLFATLHPDGLCNHFYNDGFGTLWSMIFDVTEVSVDICCGAPTYNAYCTYQLDDPTGLTPVPTIIPITKARL